MRSEDEDDPEAGGGPPPDPSTREWRHPSEIAAAAAAAARDAAPPSRAAALRPTLISAAAVTAVVGVGAIVASTVLLAGSTRLQLSGGATTSLGPGAAAALDLGAGTTTVPVPSTTLVPRPQGSATSVPTVPPTTTPTVPAIPVFDAPDGVFAGVILPAADEADTPTVSGPETSADDATFAAEARRLGGFVVIGPHVFTSASAIAGESDLVLGLDGAWLGLEALGVDPVTDLAVFRLPAALDNLDRPVLQFSADADADPSGSTGITAAAEPSDQTTGQPPTTTPTSAPTTTVEEIRPERVDDDGRPVTSSPSTSADPAGVLTLEEPRARLLTTTTTVAVLPGVDLGDALHIGGHVDTEEFGGLLVGPKYRLLTRSGQPIYGAWLASIPGLDGLSGSPVVDDGGRLVGIVADSDGPMVAIVPVATMVAVADSFEQWGQPSSLWLGIRGIRGATDGVEVRSITAGGPGHRAGLQVDDLIVEVDRQHVIDVYHLQHLVRSADPATPLVLRVERDGTDHRLEVILTDIDGAAVDNDEVAATAPSPTGPTG